MIRYMLLSACRTGECVKITITGSIFHNAELARNPIWRHSFDASRAIDRANSPPYEGVVLLVASCFF